ncbi:MAG: carbohydrate porin [Pseudomonadales bacterium]|jgi:porin
MLLSQTLTLAITALPINPDCRLYCTQEENESSNYLSSLVKIDSEASTFQTPSREFQLALKSSLDQDVCRSLARNLATCSKYQLAGAAPKNTEFSASTGYQSEITETGLGWQSAQIDYFSYTTVASNTRSGSSDFSSGGIARFYSDYLITDDVKSREQIRFKVEHRNSYTSTSPLSFVLTDIGAVGLIEPQFNDGGFRLTHLYWEKAWNQNRSNLSFGFLDPTNYVDTYQLGNPWEGFNNFIFSTGSGTMTLPDESTFGVSLKQLFYDNYYAIASISDANADSTDPFSGLFDGGRVFWSIEVGLIESPEKFYTRNLHLSYWRMDAGTRHGSEVSKGVNVSWVHQLQDWMPFFRAGLSSGDASLLSSNVTIGSGYLGFSDPSSLLGVALGWGKPNESLFGAQQEHQFTTEVFYRTELFNHLTLTPNIQYLKSLPLNPEHNESWVAGLRLKFAF